MREYRPVELSKGSFNFCKYGLASLLWISLTFQSKPLVVICFGILGLSALLKVNKAPLVLLYIYTLGKIFPSQQVILDENALRFAHTVGAVISGTALLFFYCSHPLTGWIIIGLLAFLKTSGALGYCGASKLYVCLNNSEGQCCRAGNKIKKYKCR